MSRMDYIELAAAIDGERRGWDTASSEPHNADYRKGGLMAVRLLAEHLCDVLKADNARFDRERFLTACGFKPEGEANGA